MQCGEPQGHSLSLTWESEELVLNGESHKGSGCPHLAGVWVAVPQSCSVPSLCRSHYTPLP